MALGILGRKVGMTQIYGEAGQVIPVTVIEAGPCVVLMVRTKDRDGYEAVQLGFADKPRRLAIRSERGHVAKLDSKRSKKRSGGGVELLAKAGVPCGPIYSIDEVYADPQVKYLGMAAPVKKTNVSMARQPMSLSRTPSKLVARPPELGEHTDEVLAEFGFSAKEIAALRAANAV